ncbi:GNAT family N-acetyltransferase [Vreelandella sp. TE19]
MEVQAEILKLSDAHELLEFELENRAWFEQFIAPRENEFYSLSGVQSQIKEFLIKYQSDTMVPMLLKTPDGRICGRVNLRIDDDEPETGFIGYRVGKAFTRRGVATQAIKIMQQYVSSNKAITSLKAIVLMVNPGSAKALENNSFRSVLYLDNYTVLNGKKEDAREYRWESE